MKFIEVTLFDNRKTLINIDKITLVEQVNQSYDNCKTRIYCETGQHPVEVTTSYDEVKKQLTPTVYSPRPRGKY